MTESGNHTGNGIWPSLETASRVFDLSSFGLIGGLVVGAIATALIVWMGIIKEHHWDLLRKQSNEKVATLELETAKANAEVGKAHAEIAKAQEGIAVANARAAEANLKAETERLERTKLEMKLAPRSLDQQTIDRMAKQLASLAGIEIDLIMYEAASADVPPFTLQLTQVLSKAGLKVKTYVPFGGNAVVNGILVRTSNDAPENIRAAVNLLVSVLTAAGLTAGPWEPFPAGEPPAFSYNGPGAATAKLRILVGSKG